MECIGGWPAGACHACRGDGSMQTSPSPRGGDAGAAKPPGHKSRVDGRGLYHPVGAARRVHARQAEARRGKHLLPLALGALFAVAHAARMTGAREGARTMKGRTTGDGRPPSRRWWAKSARKASAASSPPSPALCLFEFGPPSLTAKKVAASAVRWQPGAHLIMWRSRKKREKPALSPTSSSRLHSMIASGAPLSPTALRTAFGAGGGWSGDGGGGGADGVILLPGSHPLQTSEEAYLVPRPASDLPTARILAASSSLQSWMIFLIIHTSPGWASGSSAAGGAGGRFADIAHVAPSRAIAAVRPLLPGSQQVHPAENPS